MLRDKLKTEDYFSVYIDYEKARIEKFEKLIEKVIAERGVDDAVIRTRLSVFSFKINLLIASYSAGASREEFERCLIDAITYAKYIDIRNRYVEVLWLLSIACLIKINDDVFLQMVNIIDEAKMSDFLLDFIISAKIPGREISQNIIFLIPYQELKTVTETGNGLVEKGIKNYLEKQWYQGHRDSGWYDSHKSKHNTYFGYWSFESAAVVKILGLDDSSFKDNPYYPYDLVHWY